MSLIHSNYRISLLIRSYPESQVYGLIESSIPTDYLLIHPCIICQEISNPKTSFRKILFRTRI